MRSLSFAALLYVPLFVLRAEGLPLKSFITVERGVYKTGWEHDFFRDGASSDSPDETPDTLMTAPDDRNLLPDRDTLPHRQNGRVVKHRNEKIAAEQPDDAVPPEEITSPPAEEKTPPPAEPLPPVPRRPETKPAPAVAPREFGPQKETVTRTESPEPKKKQKERARELENKRKKGNFRDPKIAY